MLYKPNPDKPMHQMTLPTIDGKGGQSLVQQSMANDSCLPWTTLPNLQNLHSKNRSVKRQI